MLTINTLIKIKKKVDEPLTDKEKQDLLKENEAANYSYYCLLKEALQYKHTTVRDLLRGWGGVQLISV